MTIKYFCCKQPKAKDGNFGVALAIQCLDENKRLTVNCEFISKLAETLSVSNIDVIRIKDYDIKAINAIEIDKTRREKRIQLSKKKSNCCAILYGYFNVANKSGKPHYNMNIKFNIDVPDNTNEKTGILTSDVNYFFPKKTILEGDNEIIELNLTSMQFGFGTEFIVARIFCFRNNYETAIEILKDLKIKGQQSHKIIRKADDFLSRIYLFLANKNYTSWLQTQKNDTIMSMGEYIQQSSKYNTCKDKYITDSLELLFSIHFFLNNKIELAKKSISNNNYNIGTKHINLAFLYAYSGDLNKAYSNYKKAKNYCTEQLIAAIEIFINIILDKYPGKIELIYCLGIISWILKNDVTQAHIDFTIFRQEAEFKKKMHYVDIVSKHIEEIEKTYKPMPEKQ